MIADIRCLPDPAALFDAAATAFVQAAIDAVRWSGRFSVALAGGSTPRGVYSLLASDPRLRNTMPWDRVDFFWGDERHVAPDDPESNYRMAHEAMLSRVAVSSARVHRVKSEHPDAAVVASWYEADVRASLGSLPGIPRFDLILLGIGTDGHTASLFPGTSALSEHERLIVANWVEKVSAYRITMTLPLINAARAVLFIAAGEEKAETVRSILQPTGSATTLPAQLVRPVDGRLLWLLDAAAAKRIRVASGGQGN